MSITTLPKLTPHSPGVYIFRRGKKLLYVGKAANLKKRLISYFRKNVTWKVAPLLKEAARLSWLETSSEVEAFIKESELIKKYRPKFNYQLRDDKNYFFVGITKEEFPRIFITHQLLYRRHSEEAKRPKNLQRSFAKAQDDGSISYLGPFTSGTALKTTLRLLRCVFPYCTCKKLHKRTCLNAELGRCLDVCCLKNYRGEASIVDVYNKNIENVIEVLNGKNQKLVRELKKQMRMASIKENFEQAAKLRDQIWGLENVFSHRGSLEVRLPARSRTSTHSLWHETQKVIQNILSTDKKIFRVEGYDISNISGTDATGSMVVFLDGKPAKSEYRKFKIKTVKGANDVGMLKEVIKRRLGHPEWPYPDLMLIDGGKAQLNAALAELHGPYADRREKLLRKSASSQRLSAATVVALAKREEELYTESKSMPIHLDSFPPHTANFLKRVRDESHRFAKKYHHKLRGIFLKNNR